MKTYEVKSHTTKGKVYIVRQLNNCDWRCNCPHFIVREKKIGICKHIKEVLQKVRLGEYV